MNVRSPLLLVLFSLLLTSRVFAENSPEEPAPLNWHVDYGTAYTAACEQGRMLLIDFEASPDDRFARQFEATLADTDVQKLCREYTLLRIPTDYEVTIDGECRALLSHPAFAAMQCKAGLAIVDLRDNGSPHFGQTVSAVPFQRPVYYSPPLTGKLAVRTLLQLPAGTITQRTMVFAVRLHPEQPASTRGRADALLFAEAAGHSAYQARIGVQGHQGFDTRFQRISATLGGSPAREVVAESWPGEPLLAACFSCVKSWRGSAGHWSAVSAAQGAYAYDIRRGAGGIWYATGLFVGK